MKCASWKFHLSLGLLCVAIATPAEAQGLPACAIGMKVIVKPMSKYAHIVAAKEGAYQIRDDQDQLLDWVPASKLSSCTGTSLPSIDLRYFTGFWSTFVGPVPLTTVRDDKVWIEVSMGAHALPIQINQDGTYTWWVDSRTILHGRWRAMAAGEMREHTVGPAILIMNGESGKNWQMSRRGVDAGNGHDQTNINRMDLGISYIATRR